MSRIRGAPVLSRLRDRQFIVDAAVLAFTVLVLVLILTGGQGPEDDTTRSFDAGAAGLLAIAAALLLWGTRAPAPVVVLVFTVSIIWHAIGYGHPIINAPILIAFFMVGRWGERKREVAALALIAAVLLGVMVGAGEPMDEIVAAFGWPAIAVLFGEIVRTRTDRAKGEAETEASRRVAEERMRIARDLHDLLAHTVSVMMVQAGVADDAMERSPERAREAVRSIRAAGRDAVDEMRAMVVVLREGDDAGGVAPSPGLDRIDDLLEIARRSGLAVHVTMDPSLPPVSPIVGLTVYRLVQEALANVLRHADAGNVWLSVTTRGGQLEVVLRDDGVGDVAARDRSTRLASTVHTSGDEAGPPSSGFGLVGMAERVESLGGELDYGPTPEGGYAVRAILPSPARDEMRIP